MTKIITNHMLRQKIAEVNQQVTTLPRVTTAQTTNAISKDQEPTITLATKEIVKVAGNTMICSDGTSGPLFNPLPSIYWKCMTVCNGDGVAVLENSIQGLFIQDGSNQYCLGVTGDTSEFELRCVSGGNEVRFNRNFLNIVTEHLVKNGLEENIE